MNIIKKFLVKWIIPIGFIELICKNNDNVFDKYTVPGLEKDMTYWRVIDSKKNDTKVLIRRS